MDKKKVSSVLKKIQQLCPLSHSGLDHLKHIKKTKKNEDEEDLYCVLCVVPEDVTNISHFFKTQEINNTGQYSNVLIFLKELQIVNMSDFVVEDTTSYALDISRVPSFAPRTHEEWTEWNSIWPLKPAKLPPNIQLFDIKTNNTFEGEDEYSNLKITKKEAEAAVKYMKMAWQISEEARSKYNNVVPVGAVIVRPSPGQSDQVIATCFDESIASMSPYKNLFDSVDMSSSPCCKVPLESTHPLNHATMMCIRKVAESHRPLFETVAVVDGGRKRKLVTTGDDDKLPYVCTDCDLYITHEPCCMCAMALVHSRIRRVFYAVRNPLFGGLGGLFSIHEQKSINHRFDVFTWDQNKVI
ncbi:tRNA-specific adenosine deaminase [Acrasis kona]|uniref:tRNA-specific adenosine deaminase n=1 Tax=Acrasis kona TaxID=1008807 RepID=A0AAW2Z7Y9_9EUKA